MHIEKISPDYIKIAVQCNFVENEADACSVIYTRLSEFCASLTHESDRGIRFDLIDVNVVNNKISPGANLKYNASCVFREVFSFKICQANFKC